MKKIIIGIATLISCTAISLCSCGKDENISNEKESAKNDNKKAELNLNEYVEVTFEGNDTLGKFHMEVDYTAMVKENPKAFGLNEDEITDSTISSIWRKVRQCIVSTDPKDPENYGYVMTKSHELSNGDETTLLWGNGIYEIENIYDLDLIVEDIPFVVSGLEELKEFNPFDYIDVKFNTGTAIIEVDDSLPVRLKFIDNTFEITNKSEDGTTELDRSRDLVAGEPVIVTAHTGNDRTLEEECAIYGYKPTMSEKEYIVEFES